MKTTIAIVAILSYLIDHAVRAPWANLVAVAPHAALVLAGTFTLSFATYWAVGLVLLVARALLPDFSIDGDSVDWDKLSHVLGAILYNQLVVGNLVALIIYPLQVEMDISVHSFPSLFELFTSLACFTLIAEVLFYATHRALHSRLLYGFHKRHHEFAAPVSVVAVYAHPLEHAFSNLLPVLAGPLLLRSHLFTYWVWLVVATVNTLVVHSGIDFPVTRFHDWHHEYPRKNFGAIGLLDVVLGTKDSRKVELFEC
jgi:methylsterol monooxygenase